MKQNIEIYLDDCMYFMKNVSDNHFDLALVDPPYGIGQNWRKDAKSKFRHHRNSFNDTIPQADFFKEIFRVSKNQIIWGCNYYWNHLPPSNNLIFWDKNKDPKKQFGSAGELAWTSFKKYPLLKYDLLWNGCCRCERIEKIHPHQKPVKLYEQCLADFASNGMKIFDPFLGSGSSAIAAFNKRCDFVGVEKDPGYYLKALERIDSYLSNKIETL